MDTPNNPPIPGAAVQVGSVATAAPSGVGPPDGVSFRALALRLASGFVDNIHVNVSGAFFFCLLAAGVVHPAWKSQCTELVGYAGTYLFASSKIPSK